MDGTGGFFHGVTVTRVDTGPRVIALPSSSIIGIVDTFTPGAGLAAADTPILITNLREGVAQFGEESAMAKRLKEIYAQAAAVVVAVGVSQTAEMPAQLTSAIIGGVDAKGKRTGLQALLDAKSKTNQSPRLIVAPGHSSSAAVASAMVSLADKLRAIAIIDGPNTDDEAALAFVKNLGSKRAYVVDPG
ncbi:MAG: phage tail sheath family protein, partial [Burkholderiales bacterium]|nr:phage tail sheath family protein [Burkholderiales bacterium]